MEDRTTTYLYTRLQFDVAQIATYVYARLNLDKHNLGIYLYRYDPLEAILNEDIQKEEIISLLDYQYNETYISFHFEKITFVEIIPEVDFSWKNGGIPTTPSKSNVINAQFPSPSGKSFLDNIQLIPKNLLEFSFVHSLNFGLVEPESKSVESPVFSIQVITIGFVFTITTHQVCFILESSPTIFDANILFESDLILISFGSLYKAVELTKIPLDHSVPILYIHMDIVGDVFTTEDDETISKVRIHKQKRNHRIPKTSVKISSGGKEIEWPLFLPQLYPDLTASDFSSSGERKLYPYQPEGIRGLYRNQSFLLADDMGTGKTIMTIVALKKLFQTGKIRHTLILCPRSVLYQWKQELKKWAPELSISIVRGTQQTRKNLWQKPVHIYITTYDTIREDVKNKILKRDNAFFSLLIMDEAHHIKNPDTDRYHSIRELKPSWRWALTGTPIQNKTDDLISIFNIIYPNYFDIARNYSPEEIQEKIAPYFLRRLKKDVLKDLPDKHHEDLWLYMDGNQIDEYNQIITSLKKRNISKQTEEQQRVTLLSKIGKLKQICNFASSSDSSPKTEMLLDQIESIVGKGEKVLVYSQFIENGIRKISALLKKRQIEVALIYGGQTDTERQNEIQKFQNSSNVKVLLATIKSGGEGLNLTQATNVIHFDHWWNPAALSQAEDRAHRQGQTKVVSVYSYWMKNTLDERILGMLEYKRNQSKQMIDSLRNIAIEETLTVTELWELLDKEIDKEFGE